MPCHAWDFSGIFLRRGKYLSMEGVFAAGYLRGGGEVGKGGGWVFESMVEGLDEIKYGGFLELRAKRGLKLH